MLRVDEKMGATAEDDELLLVFWRLAGGAVEALLLEEDIFTYRFEGADDSGNPRFNLGFPDETFNMFVGCKNLSNTH